MLEVMAELHSWMLGGMEVRHNWVKVQTEGHRN